MSTSDSFAMVPGAALSSMSAEAKNRAAALLEMRVTQHLDAQMARQCASMIAADAMVAATGLTQLEVELATRYPNAAERIHFIANSAMINMAVRVQEA